jgi:hypothetical protein
MFKNIELLSKENHENLAIDKMDGYSFAKDLKFAPIGASEIAKLSCKFPVLITGGEDQYFSVLLALGNNDNYFTNFKLEDGKFLPAFMRTYPFVMVNANEQNSERVFRAVGIDSGSDYVGNDKAIKVFSSKGELSDEVKPKVTLLQNFDKDRSKANELVSLLKEHNLLDKRDVSLKVDGKEKNILTDFYVVNKERLHSLPDNLIVEWTKNGIMYALESHLNSISNIDNLLSISLKQKN